MGDRRYRVRGLPKNLCYELLKVNLLACAATASTSTRSTSTRRGSARISSNRPPNELGVDGRRDQAGPRPRAAQARGAAGRADPARRCEPETGEADASATRSARRRSRCCAIRSLLERILADFEPAAWWAKRRTSSLGYLAAVSRKLEEPLAVIMLQSSSAAGKSSLMEAVLASCRKRSASSTRR